MAGSGAGTEARRARSYWQRYTDGSQHTPTVEVKTPADVDEIKAAALSDPAKFASWPLRLQVPGHHEEWYRLSQLHKTDPKYRKLLILAATGFGKTTVWNLAVPIYEIVKDRSIQIGMLGNNLDNTKQKFRNIVSQLTGNRDLIQAFGHVDPEDGLPRFRPKSRETIWNRTEIIVAGASEEAHRRSKLFDNPTLAAFGWDSGMEGRHWDLALCDDVVDYIEAQSPIVRGQYLDWYLNVFKKRLNPNAREVWIGTRAHAADLYQHMIDSGEYTIITIPQALERGLDGQEVSTWPEQWKTEELIAERERDLVSFLLKRMNIIAGSGLTEFPREDILACRDEHLRYYGNLQNLPHDLKSRDLIRYMGVDLAAGMSVEAKFFSCMVIGVDQRTGDRYILALLRGKFGTADQRNKVRELYAAWLPRKILVENNSLQRYFYEDSFEGLPVFGVNTGSNKVDLNEGIPSLVSTVKAHRLHIPWEDAHAQVVSKPILKELEDYPRGESSDIIMSWWFGEREARTLFLQGATVNPTRNFFRKGGKVQIPARRAGGFFYGSRIVA